VGGDRRLDQVIQRRAALQPAGLTHRADPLHPAAAALGLRAELHLAHDHRVANRPLRGVVRRVDAGHLAEGPQRLLFGEESGTEAALAAIVSAGALLEQGAETIAQRQKLGGEPGQVVFVFQVGAVDGEDLARCLQEPGPAPARRLPSLGELCELASQV
jgi:hypothetical protein